MKKILVSAFAAVASAAAFAGMDNVVISFSTPGPDKYSDGTTVVDGEKYALVWTPDGETFAGINADGTAAGASKRVFAVSAAKDGKCPRIEFQVDEDYVASNFPNGTWSVVLLDTRTFVLDPETGVPVEGGDGNRVVKGVAGSNEVNGYGVVGEAKAAAGAEVTSAGGVAAASAEAASDAPAPKVKSISFDDEYVYVTITSTKPAFKYTLAAGDEPGAIAEKAGDQSSYGSAQDVIFVKPKKVGGEFFKVNCK